MDEDCSNISSEGDDEVGATGRRRTNAKKAQKAQKYKKVKSLGHFCQQFIILFVSWKRVISLEEAARQISDDEKIDDKTLKTKIRRLYDIANVLQSIGLIAKTQSKNRKPAFRWVGLQGAIESLQEIKDLVRATRETSTQHASQPAKVPIKKYAKTAEPSPNVIAPSLMKLNANAANFRGFADGLTLSKARLD